MICKGPVNRLLMMRTPGLVGPFWQNTGKHCVRTQGAYFGPGGGGSGPRAVHGIVDTATSITVNFTQCVNITAATGIEYSIDGGAWAAVTSPTGSGTTWSFTIGTVVAGEEVRWRYTAGSDTIVDCIDSEDIGNQQLTLSNTVPLLGDFIVLETGGADIILVEEDIAATDGVQKEEAP